MRNHIITAIASLTLIFVAVATMPPTAQQSEIQMAQMGGNWLERLICAICPDCCKPQPDPKPGPDPEPEPEPDPQPEPDPTPVLLPPLNATLIDEFKGEQVNGNYWDGILANGVPYSRGGVNGSIDLLPDRHPPNIDFMPGGGLWVGIGPNQPATRSDGNSKDRCEIEHFRNTVTTAPGRDSNYSFPLLIEDDWQRDSRGTYIVTQLLHIFVDNLTGSRGEPIYALVVKPNGELRFNHRPQNSGRSIREDTGIKVNDGKWHRIDWFVKWRVGQGGSCEMSVDGKVVHTHRGVNAISQRARARFKHGIYRGDNHKTRSRVGFKWSAITNGRPQYPQTTASILRQSVEGAVATPLSMVAQAID